MFKKHVVVVLVALTSIFVLASGAVEGGPLLCKESHQRPLRGICNGTTREDEVEWIDLVDPVRGPIDYLLGMFDSFQVNITAAAPIKVYWNGGSSVEPQMMEGWNRKYCGHWYNPSTWLKDHRMCQVHVSRFGIWAPYGHSKIAVVAKKQLSISALLSKSQTEIPYIVQYRSVFDARLPLFLLAGIGLWLIAPYLSHSRSVHLGSGAAMGTLGGALLLLFVLSRLVPGKKRGAIIAGLFSAIGVTLSSWWEGLVRVFPELPFWSLILSAIGGVVGFFMAYKYRLDSTSQDVLRDCLRLLSVFFISHGTSNFWLSCAVVICLACHSLFARLLMWGRAALAWYRGESLYRPVSIQPRPDAVKAVSPFADSSISSASVGPGSGFSTPSRVHGPSSAPSSSSLFALDDQLDQSPSSNPPLGSRSSRFEYLKNKLGSKASKFHFTGAEDYVSVEEYERQKMETTARELEKLKQQLAKGGDYVAMMSPAASRSISRLLSRDSDNEQELKKARRSSSHFAKTLAMNGDDEDNNVDDSDEEMNFSNPFQEQANNDPQVEQQRHRIGMLSIGGSHQLFPPAQQTRLSLGSQAPSRQTPLTSDRLKRASTGMYTPSSRSSLPSSFDQDSSSSLAGQRLSRASAASRTVPSTAWVDLSLLEPAVSAINHQNGVDVLPPLSRSRTMRTRGRL